jgi:hypothetical protein
LSQSSKKLFYMLEVTAALPFFPKPLFGAGVVVGNSASERKFQRFTVHVGHHQYFERRRILDDDGEEFGLLPVDLIEIHGVTFE